MLLIHEHPSQYSLLHTVFRDDSVFSPLVGCIRLEYNEAMSQETLSLGLLYWAAAQYRLLVLKKQGRTGPLPFALAGCV